MDTFNPNAWASADAFLQASSADYAALQETRIPDLAACVSAEQAARGKGWTAMIHQAVRTPDGGASAGVAVLARKGNGLANSTSCAVDKAHQPRLASI